VNRADWNRLAPRFDGAVCDIVAADARQVLARLVQRALTQRRHRVVVDLGCGHGTFIREFGRLFESITGLDYAPRMIARARRRCARVPGARWLCAGVERAPALLGPVADLAVCLNVLTSTQRARRDSQWAALAGVNKPGGLALVVLPSVESARFVARVTGVTQHSAKLRSDRQIRRGPHVQKLYTRQELIDYFTRFGYRKVSITRVFYPWRVEGIASRDVAAASLPWHWACLAVRGRG
jgi:SAM-dependent methyltransferase